jgi:protein-L-isoaspartate O-methyltransferase
MVIPIGPSADMQHLVVAGRTAGEWSYQRLDAVRFVPMTGKARLRP